MIHENESKATDLSSIKVVSRQASVRSIQPKKMSILDSFIFCTFLCLVGGVCTACQGVINARLGSYSGKGLSATIVFCIGKRMEKIVRILGFTARDLTYTRQ